MKNMVEYFTRVQAGFPLWLKTFVTHFFFVCAVILDKERVGEG